MMEVFDGREDTREEKIERIVVPGEKQFVDYFEKCKKNDIDIMQIKSQLPYLEKQYNKEVTVKKNSDDNHMWIYDRTLSELFENWTNI